MQYVQRGCMEILPPIMLKLMIALGIPSLSTLVGQDCPIFQFAIMSYVNKGGLEGGNKTKSTKHA